MGHKDCGYFLERDTDLGKFSHGNFDFEYQPRTATLWVLLRLRYHFEKGISEGARMAMRQRMADAVGRWDSAHACLHTRNLDALNRTLAIRFMTLEAPDYHKIVDVKRKERRAWVGMDINIWRGTTAYTLTHELGHVFGNYDEYAGDGILGFVEQHMYWHDNDHLDDKSALMNEGSDFRLRYFDHFERFVNEKFSPLDVRYGLQFPLTTTL